MTSNAADRERQAGEPNALMNNIATLIELAQAAFLGFICACKLSSSHPQCTFRPGTAIDQGAWRGDRRDQRTGGHAIGRWMPAARIVGMRRSHVANTLRLVNLPEHTRALLAGGPISAGHARALLAVAEPDAVADRIVAEGMTVRDIERVGENSGKTTRPRRASATVDADTLALQTNSPSRSGPKSRFAIPAARAATSGSPS